jgi:glutamate racemase
VSSSPIAILDSGAGGLSVVNAVRALLPHEEIHYFADTAHLPYGSKSPEFINYLALKMARRLKQLSQCKLIVVACHTISTWWLKEIEDDLNLPVIGMVAPSIEGLEYLVKTSPHLASVGVISTKATVLSLAYQKAWSRIDPSGRIALYEQPCGPLVSLVEEPDCDFSTMASILTQLLWQNITASDAVLIGCTHFSALVPALSKILKPGCHIVDSAHYAAAAIETFLEAEGLRNKSFEKKPIIAYVTDNPERFQIIARRFIEENLMIEWLPNYARS